MAGISIVCLIALQENQLLAQFSSWLLFSRLRKNLAVEASHSYHFWSYIQDMYSSDVLDEVELLDETQGVHVLTTHRSKGLEFETVYLYDMTEGNFPATRRSEAMKSLGDLVADPKDIALRHEQEERRLMYVAMTRAKRTLFSRFHSDHGGKRARKPSRFLLRPSVRTLA
jgi:superfamily I DNA/RNA helicase